MWFHVSLPKWYRYINTKINIWPRSCADEGIITLMKQRMSSKYAFVPTISFDLGLHWAFYSDNGRTTTGHISMPSDFPQCLPEMDSLALVSFLFTLSTCEPKISSGFQVRKLMSCIPTSLYHNSQTQRLTLSFFKPCLHFLSDSRDDDDD